ncbi:MAG TPA: PD-(D/E)XK nuclease family protein [Gemmatimonadales bacterium]|nr:PD-(D/E)XK nuclease family protein [Gemmatimonadales bacterium]
MPHPLVDALATLDRAHPTARKLLVGPDVNWGRELLVALARRTGGWIGWEACNLRGLAEELAFVDLGHLGRRRGSDVEITTLVDRALERAVAGRAVGAAFGKLAHGLGFRRAVQDAVLELRMAGVGAERVRAATAAGTPAHDLAAVLAGYEALLVEAGLLDPAALFRQALDAFDREAPFVLGEVVVLAPDLAARGLPGRLLERLRERGALTWPADDAADDREGARAWSDGLDLFAAATPADEIREVLRRVLREGLPWDAVEIVATDTDAYGIALDAVCQRLAIGYSSLHGVPLARTRLGRALERWLAWIDDGLPADVLREALEAGDLSSPEDSASTALARLLRSLEIGWGRVRWEAALARLRAPGFAGEIRRREEDDDAAHAERVEARRRTAASLAALVERLLAITPAVPERGSDLPVPASAPALARATLGYLALVPLHDPAEVQAMIRLRARLEELAEVADEATGFGAALARLRDALADLRAWTQLSADRHPWSAGGGMPHLTDLAHAGTTGRPRVFVVGLDAERAAGGRVGDPILGDAARQAIDPAELPTTAARREERARLTARALGRLRGRVTLSYAVAAESGDREVGPAHLLLEAFRHLEGDPSRSYDDLRARLGAPACAVPAAAADALDPREAWLAVLADGAMLLDGVAAVRAAHPLLDAGLHAATARAGAALTAHHGVVPAAAGRFDPRRNGRPVSPTSLELLAKCPLAWFYKYGLRLQPPGDPEYDAEAWLDAMQRGALLHGLYERFAREYHGRQEALAADAARECILAMADEAIAGWRARVPPPSEAVFATEAQELREAALAFLDFERRALEQGDTGRWLDFELEFPYDRPARLPLPGGEAIHVTGKIDRVDRLADGTLRIIDYKTGKPSSYVQGKDDGPFKGGRALQGAVYAAAAAEQKRLPVSRFEYRFPTPRGENRSVEYGPAELALAGGIIAGVLGHAERGEFVSTTATDDCKYCDFQELCRAERDGHRTTSPRAEWAEAHAPGLAAYTDMLRRRAPAAADAGAPA